MKSGRIWKALALTAIAVFITACPKTKTSRATSASVASVITLSSTSYNLQPGAQATVTASGGTGTYSSYNATTGSLQIIGKGQYAYTAPALASGVTAAVISVTDSAGVTGMLTINIQGAVQSGNALAVYTSAYPIPISGTVQLSVQGGTGPYTWTITSGGGTLDSNTGAVVSYTALNTAGSVGLTVSDSAGNTLSGSIPIAGQAVQTTCNGNFQINSQSHGPGILTLVKAANGTITGSLSDGGGTFTLTGSCTATNITFTLSDGKVYTGGFYYTTYDPYVASMVGTYNGGQWVAVPQH